MTQSDCGHYSVFVHAHGAIVREEEFASYVSALSYFLQQAEAFAFEGMTVSFKEKKGGKWIIRFITAISDSRAEADLEWIS